MTEQVKEESKQSGIHGPNSTEKRLGCAEFEIRGLLDALLRSHGTSIDEFSGNTEDLRDWVDEQVGFTTQMVVRGHGSSGKKGKKSAMLKDVDLDFEDDDDVPVRRDLSMGKTSLGMGSLSTNSSSQASKVLILDFLFFVQKCYFPSSMLFYRFIIFLITKTRCKLC